MPRQNEDPLVLLVEDDPQVSRVVEETLKTAAFRIKRAATVAEFPSSAPEKPDLYILDAGLPDGNGFDLCKQIRADPATSEIPVLFLTAREDIHSRLQAFEAGAQDYVVKPFSPAELLARVKAHVVLKRKRDEIEQKVGEAALKERIRRDLIDMLVHDLRSPLGTVKLTLRMLIEENIVSDQQYARLIQSADGVLDLVLVMVNDLLDLGAGRVPVDAGPMTLPPLIARVEALVHAQAARRKVGLGWTLVPRDGPFRCDEKLVLRVLINLVVNAIKFTPPDGRVEISLNASGGRLRMAVSDTGPGVPDQEKEAIFEKYHRGPGSSLAPGSGIGLSFCRLAAQNLGGRVWVEDRPGGGSRFIFEVPVEEAAEGSDDLFGPEVMKEYLQDCTAMLGEARLAAASPGPENIETLRLTAHRLAGSAGTYGFPAASEAARALETRIKSRLRGETDLSAAEIQAALDKIEKGLGLPPSR